MLSKGYEVHGFVRRVVLETPEQSLWRLMPVLEQIQLHSASLENYAGIHRAISEVQPDECYHLAAQSFVSYAFDDEFSTLNTNINGTHHLLAALRRFCRSAVSTSRYERDVWQGRGVPQNERTGFHPRSIYGISKVAGFELTRNYRDTYKMHACGGILFNHESPRGTLSS